MFAIVKKRKRNSNKNMNKYGVKRERKMRYSIPKTIIENFDSGKANVGEGTYPSTNILFEIS